MAVAAPVWVMSQSRGDGGKDRKPSGGFSLLEILSVMAMMSVVALIAAPKAAEFTGQYQLVAAADQLAFEISRARMQAVGQNAFVRIRLTNVGYVRERSTDGGVTYVSDDVPVKLPSGIKAAAGDTGTPSFDRNGLATKATTITMTWGSTTKTIRTNVLGRVTVS